jgi:hypothetical protein
MKKETLSTNIAGQAQAADWQPIKSAPIGPAIILANEKTGVVCAGYGEWVDGVSIPLFAGVDDTGFGRFKATNWTPFPKFEVKIE